MSRASQTQRKQFFASTDWAAWHQKSGNRALRAYTRFPDTPFSSQQGCVTPRNWHQRCPTTNRTQNLPKDDQFAAGIAMIAIDHPQRQPHGRNCPAATSSQTPKCGNHGPQFPAQTACASSPTRQPEPKSLETFHSKWLTETNKWANMWRRAYTYVPGNTRI